MIRTPRSAAPTGVSEWGGSGSVTVDGTTGATVFDVTFGPSSGEPTRRSPVSDDGRTMRLGAPTVKNRNRGYVDTRGCCVDVV